MTPKISVIIPIFGNVGDLELLIKCLNAQTLLPYEIILVDSGPAATLKIGNSQHIRYIRHLNSAALSGDYNVGLAEAKGDYVLLMQQDCVPASPTTIENLYVSIKEYGAVSASAMICLPGDVYQKYNFWGKVMMARWRGTIVQGISGKCDLIRKDVLQRISGYDTKNFFCAGEDMDLCLRLMKEGGVKICADAVVLHKHQQNKPVTIKDFLRKKYQLAESFGALFRKWNFQLANAPYAGNFSHHIGKLLYPMAILWIARPIALTGPLFLLSQFINVEAWTIKSWKLPVLLLVNPIVLCVELFGSIVGFTKGKQTYSVTK